jgi:hypothetical protein
MRWLAPVPLVLAVACTTAPRLLDEGAVHAAGDALADGLRTLDVKDSPTLRVSDGSDPRLVEEGERRALECGKFRVSRVIPHPDYVLLVSLSRDTITWEVVALATKHRVLVATKRVPN